MWPQVKAGSVHEHMKHAQLLQEQSEEAAHIEEQLAVTASEAGLTLDQQVWHS